MTSVLSTLKFFFNVVCLSLASVQPSIAQGSNNNESEWRLSIEADIRNGAPADYICGNTMSSARFSDDARFKDWAYGIARQYCPPGELGKPSKPPPYPTNSAPNSLNPFNRAGEKESQQVGCRIMSGIDAERIRSGASVNLSGDGCVMIFNPRR